VDGTDIRILGLILAGFIALLAGGLWLISKRYPGGTREPVAGVLGSR
jgi:hypothetical protein